MEEKKPKFLTEEDFNKIDQDKIVFMMYRKNVTDKKFYYFIKDKKYYPMANNLILSNLIFGVFQSAMLQEKQHDRIKNMTSENMKMDMLYFFIREMSKSAELGEYDLIDYESLNFEKSFTEFTEVVIMVVSDFDKLEKQELQEGDLSIIYSPNVTNELSVFFKHLVIALSGVNLLPEGVTFSSYVSNLICNFIGFMDHLYKTEGLMESIKADTLKKIEELKAKTEDKKNDNN